MRTVHIEYVEWCFERGTKTRTGEIAGIQERAFRPKMFAVGTDHCPVQYFKDYIDHRPLTANMLATLGPILPSLELNIFLYYFVYIYIIAHAIIYIHIYTKTNTKQNMSKKKTF